MTSSVIATRWWMAALSYNFRKRLMGDPLPSLHSRGSMRPSCRSPHFSVAKMLTSVSYMFLSYHELPVYHRDECNALCCRVFSYPSNIVVSILSAAYAVIANGQVECPAGYKRMNMTHCQGKNQVFLCTSATVCSVWDKSPYVFYIRGPLRTSLKFFLLCVRSLWRTGQDHN